MWTLAATKEGLWGLPAAGHGRVWHWLSPELEAEQQHQGSDHARQRRRRCRERKGVGATAARVSAWTHARRGIERCRAMQGRRRGSSGGWEELCCSAMVAMAMVRNWTSKGEESER